MKVNFILTECTFLRYFLPLIIECNKRSIDCCMYVGNSNKYNCPQLQSNYEVLIDLSRKYDFETHSIEKIKDINDQIFFCVEGCGINKKLCSQNKVYSITYMTDFLLSDKYIDKVDYVVFPSKKFADFYKMKNKKYLFLGSPKYDYKSQEKQVIAEKYGIDLSKKIALYMAPNNDYNHLLQNTEYSHEKTIEILKQKGYYVICKSRGKNTITYNHLFDNVIYDGDWFPHPSLEILKISDIMINFNSTAIKEAVLSKVPVIDIKIKKYSTEKDRLDFLYNYKYCFNLDLDDLNSNKIIQAIDHCESIVDEDFQESISNNLFEIDGTCRRIIDFVVNDL